MFLNIRQVVFIKFSMQARKSKKIDPRLRAQTKLPTQPYCGCTARIGRLSERIECIACEKRALERSSDSETKRSSDFFPNCYFGAIFGKSPIYQSWVDICIWNLEGPFIYSLDTCCRNLSTISLFVFKLQLHKKCRLFFEPHSTYTYTWLVQQKTKIEF